MCYPVQDIPRANADAYSIDEDTTLSISAADGLLANDVEVDGEELTLVGAQFLTEDETTVVIANPEPVIIDASAGPVEIPLSAIYCR